MRTPAMILGLTLAFLYFNGAHSATITFRNNCPYTVWPATLTAAPKPQLPNTGFELAAKATSLLDVKVPWTGRFWARTQCSKDNLGKFTCATADCRSGQVACKGNSHGIPASIVEFLIAEKGGQDFYDVSLVDGFNLPVSVAPQGGSGVCGTSSCPVNINTACPAELAVKGSNGSVIACKTACEAFNQPQYCCTTQKCQPTKYSKFFKERCPLADSPPNDDQASTFTCSGGPNYLITFCP
uniref:Thaumatin-like protein n=1 Tax=Fagus sylvatica TaxID=28930 RepID=A0A2N9FTS6_FAGSY